MPQPVLTRWEYVGMAIDWVINKFLGIRRMAQCVINTSAAISSRNVIASAIYSLTNETLIMAHMHILKGYHDASFNIHFQWMKHVDKRTKKNGYLSAHMAVHFFVMHTKLTHITNEWQTMPIFSPFLTFCNTKILNPIEKEVATTVMPKKFFDVAHQMLIKHFDQWRSPMLLPLVLGGDDIPTKAIAGFMCDIAIAQPPSYYSEIHHAEINVSLLTSFLTEKVSTIEKKNELLNRDYFILHRPAIEKLARGWVVYGYLMNMIVI